MDMRRCSIEFITLIPVEKVTAATGKFVIVSYTVVLAVAYSAHIRMKLIDERSQPERIIKVGNLLLCMLM